MDKTTQGQIPSISFCPPEDISIILVLTGGVTVAFSSEESVRKFTDILDLENSELDVVQEFITKDDDDEE